jgi:hypothetical protein
MTESAPIPNKHPSISIIGYRVFTYGDLENELLAVVLGLQGVQNGRDLLGVKLDCAQTLVGCFSLRAQSWRRRRC